MRRYVGAGPDWVGLPVIPSPSWGGHGAVRWQHAGSIKWATTPGRGSDSAAAARVLGPGCSRRFAGIQGSHVPVAQPVVDQGERFARRGDLGDVLAAA